MGADRAGQCTDDLRGWLASVVGVQCPGRPICTGAIGHGTGDIAPEPGGQDVGGAALSDDPDTEVSARGAVVSSPAIDALKPSYLQADAVPVELDHATAARVMRIISAELGFDHALRGAPITLDSRIAEDLNIDSLTRVVIAAEIEDHFDIAISDDALAGANTVSDLFGLVAVRLMNAGR